MISGKLFVDGAAGCAFVGIEIAGALVAGVTGGLRNRFKFVTPKTVS